MRQLYSFIEINDGLTKKQEREVDRLVIEKTNGRLYEYIRSVQMIIILPVLFVIMVGMGKEQDDGGESISPWLSHTIPSAFYCIIYFFSN